MLRKLKLYGELAEFVGHKEFEIQVDSLAKAVSFLVNNFPQVEKYMNPQYYQVKVGNYTISKEEIHYPIGQEDIHIVPVISGAGRGAGRILGGAALIGLAFATGGASLTFAQVPLANAGALTGVAFSSGIAKAAVYLGGALVLSGVSDMLFPLPKPQEFKSEQDPQLSFSFSGTQNTSRAGTPVPIVYGEIVTGSVVISGAVDTQQVQA
jgi:predicted phage tail protein